MFRLMGGLSFPKRFPLTARITAIAPAVAADVAVVGTDGKGWYLVSGSARRGARTRGERTFPSQFPRVCAEL